MADPIPNDVAISNTSQVVCSSVLDTPIANMSTTQLESESESESRTHKLNGVDDSVHNGDRLQDQTVTSVDGPVSEAETKVSSKNDNCVSCDKNDLLLDVFNVSVSLVETDGVITEKDNPPLVDLETDGVITEKDSPPLVGLESDVGITEKDSVPLVDLESDGGTLQKDDLPLVDLENDGITEKDNLPLVDLSDEDGTFEKCNVLLSDIMNIGEISGKSDLPFVLEANGGLQDNLTHFAVVDDGKTVVDNDVDDALDDVNDLVDDEDEVLHHSVDSNDFKNYLTLGHEIEKTEENAEFIVACSQPESSVDDDSEHISSCLDSSSRSDKDNNMKTNVESHDINVESDVTSDNKETKSDDSSIKTDSLLIGTSSEEVVSNTVSTQLGTTVDSIDNNNHEDKYTSNNELTDSDGTKTNTELISVENQPNFDIKSDENESSFVENSTGSNDLSHQKIIKCDKFSQQISVDSSSADDRNTYNESLPSHVDSSISQTANQNPQLDVASCQDGSSELKGRVLCACGQFLIDDLNEGEFDENEFEGEFHEDFDDYHVEGFHGKHDRKVQFEDNSIVHSSSAGHFKSHG